VPADVPGGAIAADERVGRVLAGVDDVPEELALGVLRARRPRCWPRPQYASADVSSPQRPTGRPRTRRKPRPWSSSIAPGAHAGAQRLEAKVLAPDLTERQTARLHRGTGMLELRDVPRRRAWTIQSERAAISGPRQAAATSSGARSGASCSRWK
jgi:hypothetical protein